MTLSNKENEYNSIIVQLKEFEKKERYAQVLQLCDKITDNYADLLDLDKQYFLNCIRGRAYTKVKKYAEAMRVLGELLEYNIKNQIPIASSKNMYRWLCAYYEGDEKKALDEFILLNDEKAINLLRQTDMSVQEKSLLEGSSILLKKWWQLWKK